MILLVEYSASLVQVYAPHPRPSRVAEKCTQVSYPARTLQCKAALW
jgi:hypothetical protein